MATRISFSTHYPDRMGDLAGKPTYFVEKIVKGLHTSPENIDVDVFVENAGWEGYSFDMNEYCECHPKTTTIRSNYKYWKSKEGQLLQPFFWAGKPYRSKHVVFCPEVRLAKVLKAEINNTEGRIIATDVEYDSGFYVHANDQERIMRFTQNEGFDDPDHFWMWFNEDYDGALLEFESEKI